MSTVPDPTPHEIAAAFSNALDGLTENQLVILMDDYKAMATVAAIHGDRAAMPWLEDRVHRITEAYGDRCMQPELPF